MLDATDARDDGAPDALDVLAGNATLEALGDLTLLAADAVDAFDNLRARSTTGETGLFSADTSDLALLNAVEVSLASDTPESGLSPPATDGGLSPEDVALLFRIVDACDRTEVTLGARGMTTFGGGSLTGGTPVVIVVLRAFERARLWPSRTELARLAVLPLGVSLLSGLGPGGGAFTLLTPRALNAPVPAPVVCVVCAVAVLTREAVERVLRASEWTELASEGLATERTPPSRPVAPVAAERTECMLADSSSRSRFTILSAELRAAVLGAAPGALASKSSMGTSISVSG